MNEQDHADAFREGAEVGRQPTGGAADCPYLPGTDLAKRSAWMKGFSSVRAETPQAAANTDKVRVGEGHAPHGG